VAHAVADIGGFDPLKSCTETDQLTIRKERKWTDDAVASRPRLKPLFRKILGRKREFTPPVEYAEDLLAPVRRCLSQGVPE
jgi:hypothetical protein